MPDSKAQQVIRDWEKGYSDSAQFRTNWQDIANYIIPDRSDYIIERSPGQKRMSYVYDATPVFALDMFAGGMHSLLTSPTLPWFALWTEDDRTNNMPDVKAWLEIASDVMYRYFNGAKQGFASASHELYLDLGSIGSACMFITENYENAISFKTGHMKGIVLILDADGHVCGLIRKWKWTARQAVEEWGIDKVGPMVAKGFADDPDKQKWTFYQSIIPRRKRDEQNADAKNMAWESIFVAEADQIVIAESGFREFSAACPRFSKLSEETYGRGPGWTNLPDVKMLNELAKLVIKAAQKVIDPPLQAPDEGFIVPIRTLPGSMNYYRASSNGRIEPIKTEGNIPIGLEMQNALRQQIMRGFYVEWMMMPTDPRDPASAGKGVTATYTMTWREQVMRMLSPMLSRSQEEFTGPAIDRVFPLLWRRSVARKFNTDPSLGPVSPFPAPPAQLAGSRLRVEYVSPIALAQKSAQMDAVGKLLQMQQELRTMDPQGQLILSPEMSMRIAAKDWNAPANILRTPDDLAAERQQAQQAAQAQQQGQGLTDMAGAAKDGATAVNQVAQAHAAVNQPQQQAA